jgi:hypothetical protein
LKGLLFYYNGKAIEKERPCPLKKVPRVPDQGFPTLLEGYFKYFLVL